MNGPSPLSNSADPARQLPVSWPVWLIAAAIVWSGIPMPGPAPVAAQETPDAATEDADPDAPAPLTAADTFEPDFEDTDLAGSEDRAWEYRPYRVAVWFCLDGSPMLDALYDGIARDVTARSELLDPSGWDLITGRCPSRYRRAFLQHLDQPERVTAFPDLRVIEPFDKIMVVCLEDSPNHTLARVREFDVQTQQWGPLAIQQVGSRQALAAELMSAIAQSFMPIAIIDRVTEIEETDASGKRRLRDEVVMQSRAVKACVRSVLVARPAGAAATVEIGSDSEDENAADRSPADDRFTLVAQPSASAPAFVRPTDRFLPIIRRNDRDGNLVKLEPLEFTFLTIDQLDGPLVRASIQSSFRAPLSQRASRRAQKLALVIRPPENATVLRLVTRGDDPQPLEGMEVYSRSPQAVAGDDNEMLGLTDWRGEISIPPTDDGLRLILVKRGSRPLKRIPIIPGLFQELETTLPDDETRLYAEGVFRGLENRILALIVQRDLATKAIESALEKKNLSDAKSAFDNYQELVPLNDLKERVATAASDLKFLTNNPSEVGYIDSNLTILNGILDRELKKSRDSEYLEKIQNLTLENRAAQ